MRSEAMVSRILTAVLAALVIAGCGPKQAIRPPQLAPDADQGARQKIYDDYHLDFHYHPVVVALPLGMRFGERAFWKRADGSYSLERLQDVIRTYPETLALVRPDWGKAFLQAGVFSGILIAEIVLIDFEIPVVQALATFDGYLACIKPDSNKQEELTETYNQALARSLELPAQPSAPIAAPSLAGTDWLGLNLCLEGFAGASVQSRQDWNRIYGGLDRGSHRPYATFLHGLSGDYALTDHVQIGAQWEPYLSKRTTVKYSSGDEDRWTLDAHGILGRARVFVPLGPTLGLVTILAVGQYALDGGKLETTYSYRRSGLSGNATGGECSFGLERLFSRSAGIYTGIGYRLARINHIRDGNGAEMLNRDGSPMFVEHSGIFFSTAWRYYWGIAHHN